MAGLIRPRPFSTAMHSEKPARITPEWVGGDLYVFCNKLVDFTGMENMSIQGKIYPLDMRGLNLGKEDNKIVSVAGLSPEHYEKVVGLSVSARLGEQTIEI